MFGGSNVVIASRSRIGRLDGRDRLRRQLLAISYHTVTSAGTRAGTRPGTRPSTSARTGPGTAPAPDPAPAPAPVPPPGPAVASVTIPVGAELLGNRAYMPPGTGRRSGHYGDVDEYRLDFPHDDIGCHWVELGNRRSRPTVLIRVSDRRNFPIPLRHSPRNGGKGCRSLTVGYLTSRHPTRAPLDRSLASCAADGPLVRRLSQCAQRTDRHAPDCYRQLSWHRRRRRCRASGPARSARRCR